METTTQITKAKRITKAMQRQHEKDEARVALRALLRPGDTISTILRHCSRSGMYRSISLVVVSKGEQLPIDRYASTLLGEKIDRHGGIGVGGCGMDMGFHLVYSLSRALFPDGFGCPGRKTNAAGVRTIWCNSNDHSNGDRDYTRHTTRHKHWHQDGGYALRHQWL
jgi:hypothetical protein